MHLISTQINCTHHRWCIVQGLGYGKSRYKIDRVCHVSAPLLEQSFSQRRSIEEHLSSGRALCPFRDHVQEASLSAALGPEYRHYLSTVHGQVRALQDQCGSVAAQTSSGIHLQKCNKRFVVDQVTEAEQERGRVPPQTQR